AVVERNKELGMKDRDFRRLIAGQSHLRIPAAYADEFKSWYATRIDPTASPDWVSPIADKDPEVPGNSNSSRSSWPLVLAGLGLAGAAVVGTREYRKFRNPFSHPPMVEGGFPSMAEAGAHIATQYQGWRRSLPQSQQVALPENVTFTGRVVDLRGDVEVEIPNGESGSRWVRKNIKDWTCGYEFRSDSGTVLYDLQRCGNGVRARNGMRSLSNTQVRDCEHQGGHRHQPITVTAWSTEIANTNPTPTPEPPAGTTPTQGEGTTPAPAEVTEDTTSRASTPEPTAPAPISSDKEPVEFTEIACVAPGVFRIRKQGIEEPAELDLSSLAGSRVIITHDGAVLLDVGLGHRPTVLGRVIQPAPDQPEESEIPTT
ncbi:MAG: hypothetical protein V1826_01235, partial [bacterium]